MELICGELGLDVEYVPMEWSEALCRPLDDLSKSLNELIKAS